MRWTARELVDARSNYRPLPGSTPAQFMQMEATSELLRSIADANKSVLKDLTMSKAYEGISLDPSKRKASLWDLAQQGILDSEISWVVFSTLWDELTLPNTPETESLGKRPPILYCADNISHILVPSRYQVLDREANLHPIHALDLLLPKHFIDHVSGAKSFPNGGITLGATSKSDTISCPPLEVGIRLGQARLESPEANLQVSDFWNPLRRIDQRVMDVLSNLDVITLKGIPKEDTKSLIEYWAYSGMVRERISDSWIGEKWTLSGGGILGELEKSVVRMRF
jgi:small subunit ribosomal protein S29